MNKITLLALASVLTAMSAFSQTLAGEQAPADDTALDPGSQGPPGEEGGWLEGTRSGLYRLSYNLVEEVDSWFGPRPFDESGGQVSGSLSLRLLQREDEGLDADVRYRLRVKMPNVSSRANLIIGREDEADLVTDQQQDLSKSQVSGSGTQVEDPTTFVGLAYRVRDDVSLRLGVRGGYKLFAQARFNKRFTFSERSILDFSETLFLAVDDGLGATTGLNYRHAVSERAAWIWPNSLTYGTETDGLEWRTAPGYQLSWPGQKRFVVDLPANGETGSTVDVSEYGVRARYRTPLHREWLLGELIVGYFRPRDEDDPSRRDAWALGGTVEIQF